jgi:hypothetical protein
VEPDAKAKAEKSRKEELQKEARRRLLDARAQKRPFELDMREGYYFAAPQRMRSVNSEVRPTTTKPNDEVTLYTEFGFELCGDFPTVIINTFFPDTQKWVVRRAGPMVPEGMRQKVEQQAEEADEAVFKSILASNFYAECGKAFNPDLALGTVALWIEHPRAYEPPVVQAVPLRELEINVGTDGNVDDRFLVRHTKHCHLKAILPDIKIPKEVSDKGGPDGKKACCVVWGFWRIYDDTQEEKWQHTVTVDNVLVHDTVLKGAGSCPLVVARFNAKPEWAWGIGPLIQALPGLRSMDELQEMKLKAIALSLAPPVSFPDGSFANIQDGIEAGMAYAVRPGEEGAIKNIYDPPSLEAAIFMTEEQERRLKRLFFLDWPQQRGDTPPTATQWLDEMTMAQRRIGTPGLVFWREFCGGVFQRYLRLLEDAGQVDPIEIEMGDGRKRPVSLMPYNPAQRAAEQEEVALFARFVQIGAAAFPEEWKLTTDGSATLQNVADKMGVNRMWAQRDKEAIAGAISNIAQLAGGMQAGAPAIQQGQAPAPDMAGANSAPPAFSIKGEM